MADDRVNGKIIATRTVDSSGNIETEMKWEGGNRVRLNWQLVEYLKHNRLDSRGTCELEGRLLVSMDTLDETQAKEDSYSGIWCRTALKMEAGVASSAWWFIVRCEKEGVDPVDAFRQILAAHRGEL